MPSNVNPHSAAETQEQAPPPLLTKQLRRFLLVVMPMLIGLHLYIGWRLLPALPISHLGEVFGWLLLGLSALLMPLSMLARFLTLKPSHADRLSWVGSLVMGLFSSILVLTILRDIVLLIFGTPALISMSAILVILTAIMVTIIGLINARRLARVVRVDIPLKDLPASLNGFTIAQISDIHVGPTIKGNYVAAIVGRVNELGADLIAITGDVVDGSVAQLAPHTAHLADLKARHGAFIVTGNHEYYSGALEWLAEFDNLGIQSLINEHVVIEHRGARLVIAGVTDYSAHAFDASHLSDPVAAISGSPDGVHKILLAHQPRTAHVAALAGFDLQLSGHTHGGQFWPWNLFVGLQQPFTAGLHRLDKLWIYTSRGTGYWGPPKRFGAPSEITLLRLMPA